MPTIRIVTVPAKNYYSARESLELMRPIAAQVIDDIVKALTTPLTEAEKNPKIEVEGCEPITVTAESYTAAIEKLNQLFLDNRWSDALPIVPPTREAVDWMLTGTSRSPNEVVGRVAPKNGLATIEKIAINAVMAGAKPEYLPVIIAAIEGLTDKSYDLLHLQTSTGSITPVIIVNGPIVKEIGMNSKIGFLGDGWRANSTIGRAVNLCLINLGWTWPQVNDQGLMGRPEVYCGFTFAENEEDSPWPPYHVRHGFKPDQSTVTVSSGMVYDRMGPGGAVSPQTMKEALNTLAWMVARMGTPATYSFRTWIYMKKYIITIHPALARALAKAGYTPESLAQWLYEHARFPYKDLRPRDTAALRKYMKKGLIPPEVLTEEDLKQGRSIPAVISPDQLHIFVAGGEPAYCALWCDPKGPKHVTKLIHGATLTKAGR